MALLEHAACSWNISHHAVELKPIMANEKSPDRMVIVGDVEVSCSDLRKSVLWILDGIVVCKVPSISTTVCLLT
jgi:hypothetical protein